jgi:hypothetical protein
MSTIRQHATDSDSATDYFRTGQGIPCRTVAVRRDALEADPFDEALPAREDPHLWTRLLRECDGVHIDAPLATKRRRPDSLTADSAAVRDAELAAIEDLCARYPDLRPYRAEREAEARFRAARSFLRRGDTAAARRECRQVDRAHRDYRMWACLGVSLLPEVVAPRIWGLLEAAQEVVK